MSVNVLIFLAFLAINSSLAAKIVVMPQFGRSHYLVMSKLADELLGRGHQVSILLGEEAEYAIGKPNVKVFKMSEEEKKKTDDLVELMTKTGINFMAQVSGLFELQKNYCDLFLSSEEMMSEVDGADVLIGDALYQCSSLVADKFDIPHVTVNMDMLSSPFQRTIGMYSNPSYIPELMSGLSSNMGFFDRIKNLGFSLVNTFIIEALLYPLYNELKLKHKIKPNKGIRDSMARVDLVLMERDFIMDNAQPILPNIREVGYFMPSPAQPLPAELEEFMQGSGDDGVILVSFGSMVDTLRDDIVRVMNEAFSKVPQKVLWRLRPGSFKVKLSPNIKTVKWLPQNDILGHKKTKLFITHAGANGLAEAAYHGVPMICSPFFGDQMDNAQFAKDVGIGETLSVKTATAEQLVGLVNRMISEKRYKERSSHISKVMKKRPRHPVKEAADLIEYVQAVGNLDHLKPRGLDLPFYQLYMLDVFLVLLLAVAVLLIILKALLGLVLRVCCGVPRKAKMS